MTPRRPPTFTVPQAVVLGVGLVLLILGFTAWARAAEIEGAFVAAEFAPPHNEPDVLKHGQGVARYAFTAGGRARLIGRLRLEGQLRWWAQQPWRAPEEVGGGLSAWAGSDWSIRNAVTEWRYGLEYPFGRGWALITESLGSGSPEIPYYHMVGVKKEWE